jgi:hypothetical protein
MIHLYGYGKTSDGQPFLVETDGGVSMKELLKTKVTSPIKKQEKEEEGEDTDLQENRKKRQKVISLVSVYYCIHPIRKRDCIVSSAAIR